MPARFAGEKFLLCRFRSVGGMAPAQIYGNPRAGLSVFGEDQKTIFFPPVRELRPLKRVSLSFCNIYLTDNNINSKSDGAGRGSRGDVSSRSGSDSRFYIKVCAPTRGGTPGRRARCPWIRYPIRRMCRRPSQGREDVTRLRGLRRPSHELAPAGTERLLRPGLEGCRRFEGPGDPVPRVSRNRLNYKFSKLFNFI